MFFCNEKPIKTVGFFGLGKSNLGVMSYLKGLDEGLKFILRSEKDADFSPSDFERVYLKENALSDIREDILFLSPSVRRDRAELTHAKSRGVILFSDAELFFSGARSDIYAVTGSDGKSTTTYLTSRLLSRAYQRVYAIGNIGEAMSPHLDDGKDVGHVIELSSFQLSCMKPKTKRAVITNITENHLNWHKSFREYIDAKKNILYGADERIINFDCPITREISKSFDIFAVFSKELCERDLRSRVSAKLYITLSDGIIHASGEPMLDTRKIRARGEHNILNFMSAIAMSYGVADKKDISALAEDFTGLGHRCELIHEAEGVRYYDSSIDSSPNRCVKTLSAFRERVILILGGKSKGLDFSELLPALKEKAKKIVLTGECLGEILEALERDPEFSSLGIPVYKLPDFTLAVECAKKIAERGDSVLLSPSATSYDSFHNFEERGDRFAKIIKEITK